MANSLILKVADWFIKPEQWYEYSRPTIEGFCFIGSKEDQKNAGYIRKTPKPANEERKRKFGMNPVKPYRDYYGRFQLKTRLLPDQIEVLFALGYTMNQKVVTVDDYSNFSWLRLATGLNDIIYPNLAHQKQLLDYLAKHSKYSKFVISRVYHYLEFALLQDLKKEILRRESGEGKE
jgi:hypothetical protein